MRPVVYSCVDASTRGIGWLRSGSDISYYCNSYQRHNTSGEGNSQYYTLSFTVEFQHAKDTVLIAYSYPYSVADYKAHIRDILHRPYAFDIIRSSRLCTTLGGENCDLLVITNFKVCFYFWYFSVVTRGNLWILVSLFFELTWLNSYNLCMMNGISTIQIGSMEDDEFSILPSQLHMLYIPSV